MTSSGRPVVSVRFVDVDVDVDRNGDGGGKIACTGELPASDWTNAYRSSRVICVPFAGVHEEVHVDVDKARRVARLRARSGSVSLDILVRLPDDRFLVVDDLKAEESHPMMRRGSWIVLSLPHANRERWCSLTVDLYRAGLEADEGAWAATWAAIRRPAVEQLPAADGRAAEVAAATGLPDDLARAVAGREALALFEDPGTRKAGWSHGACSTALWAVHECAWKHAGAPKGAAAARLMAELLAECDVDADEARRMVGNGLPRCASADADADVDESAWVAVDTDRARLFVRRLFVHRAILDRFDLPVPIPVVTFGYMPIELHP